MAQIVKLLDTLPVAAGIKIQIVHLKNADPINTMNMLREIFTQGRGLAGRPRTPTVGRAVPEGVVGEALTNVLNVTADARTNALVLSGTEETVALAMVLVKDLDAQPTSEFTEVKTIKLAHADAVALAGLIRAVFAEGPAAAPGVQGARAYVTKLKVLREKVAPVSSKIARTHPTLVVQAERNTNILIIAARSDLMPIITEMVKTMDIPGAGSLNVVRIYPLKNADATRMATVVNGLYTGPNQALIRPEDRPTIAVDTRTNALVVSSSEKTFAVIDALLLKLDAKLPIDLRDIRLLPLKNADAATLAPTLQRMMDARVQRQQSLGVGDAEALRMVIVADARSNYLIVGGSAEGYKLVQDLAAKLDAAPPRARRDDPVDPSGQGQRRHAQRDPEQPLQPALPGRSYAGRSAAEAGDRARPADQHAHGRRRSGRQPRRHRAGQAARQDAGRPGRPTGGRADEVQRLG
jgi:type II secretory pathway component GspD/PulD (secretin)